MAGLSSSLKLPAGNSFLAVSVCNRNKQKALTLLRHYEKPIEVTTSADPSPLCETLRPMTKGHSTFVVCHQTWRNVRLYILFCLLCIYLNIIFMHLYDYSQYSAWLQLFVDLSYWPRLFFSFFFILCAQQLTWHIMDIQYCFQKEYLFITPSRASLYFPKE